MSYEIEYLVFIEVLYDCLIMMIMWFFNISGVSVIIGVFGIKVSIGLL